MAKGIGSAAAELGEKIAEEQNVHLVDAEFVKEGGEKYLRLYIDKEGGVGIDDCEAFSTRFSEVFDENDPIEGNYILEVSSPGADRILKKEKEFLYYIGREVDVKLYKALEGVKEFTGELTGFEDKKAYIKTEKKEYEIPVKEAAYIRLHFEM